MDLKEKSSLGLVFGIVVMSFAFLNGPESIFLMICGFLGSFILCFLSQKESPPKASFNSSFLLGLLIIFLNTFAILYGGGIFLWAALDMGEVLMFSIGFLIFFYLSLFPLHRYKLIDRFDLIANLAVFGSHLISPMLSVLPFFGLSLFYSFKKERIKIVPLEATVLPLILFLISIPILGYHEPLFIGETVIPLNALFGLLVWAGLLINYLKKFPNWKLEPIKEVPAKEFDFGKSLIERAVSFLKEKKEVLPSPNKQASTPQVPDTDYEKAIAGLEQKLENLKYQKKIEQLEKQIETIQSKKTSKKSSSEKDKDIIELQAKIEELKNQKEIQDLKKQIEELKKGAPLAQAQAVPPVQAPTQAPAPVQIQIQPQSAVPVTPAKEFFLITWIKNFARGIFWRIIIIIIVIILFSLIFDMPIVELLGF